MARPVGIISHWWKTKKVVAVHLYNPTPEAIEAVRATARRVNEEARKKFFAEV